MISIDATIMTAIDACAFTAAHRLMRDANPTATPAELNDTLCDLITARHPDRD